MAFYRMIKRLHLVFVSPERLLLLQTSSGAVACQLLDALQPGVVNMNKVSVSFKPWLVPMPVPTTYRASVYAFPLTEGYGTFAQHRLTSLLLAGGLQCQHRV